MSRTGYYVFAYEPAWRRRGIELSPLYMPVTRPQYMFPNLPEHTFWRLPAMLADSLPDRFGNALIDAHLAKQGVSATQITALDRLTYMGERGMGALEFWPPSEPAEGASSAVVLSELVTAARNAVQGSFATDAGTSHALDALIQVGTSAGGARAKAVIAWNEETQEVHSGQGPVEDGFEHWILKFDGLGLDAALGATQNYGRIEYAYWLMAGAAGIGLPQARLLQEGGRAHFMSKRFDRVGNTKIHMQSLCALAHLDFNLLGTHDYGQLFQTIDALRLDARERDEAFRRMVFNVVAANCDDHTKNTAFLLPENGQWQLAPAYDMTHAYNSDGQWTSQHQMSVNGKFKDITIDDMLVVADRYLVAKPKALIAQIIDAVDSWETFAAAAGVPKDAAAAVRANLNFWQPKWILRDFGLIMRFAMCACASLFVTARRIT